MIESRAKDIFIPGSSTAIPATCGKRDALYEHFKAKISVNPAFDRTLVSFQANKLVP